ncbi:hypothetical protein GCM10011351_15250 [Paraliobacillus quinghaiensis]|uniref:Uncharacterized protein n=1 Tax=Paraliobacillus quinghaiensis TaxID=470815 RepID=A0A917TN61_9BACI|nr:hypothetical protein GCM10011351_15250 [Paraliobacillus quinghaiensis]
MKAIEKTNIQHGMLVFLHWLEFGVCWIIVYFAGILLAIAE